MLTRYRDLICRITVFLLLAGAVFTLKPGAVWITDNGNKYMMMRNFAGGNGYNLSHPAEKLFPAGGFHFTASDKGFVSFYPEYLSFFTVPFYKLFGDRGTLFFPLAATLLLLFMAWRYWHIPPLLLLLATPLFFYSLLFWEMTPSVFLVTMTLILAQQRKFFAAGALLGISLLMREEAYFVCAAAGAALLCCGKWRETVKFGAGFLIPAMGIWLWQYALHGHFLGRHGQNYYFNNNADFSILSQLKIVFFNYYHHLLRFDSWSDPRVNALVWSTALPLIAGAAPGFRRWKNLKYGACVCYLLSMLFLAAGVWFQEKTIYTASVLTGLLTGTPVILGFLVNWHAFLRCKKVRFMALFAILYIIGVPPLMTASDIGLIWGARHFLVLLPLLVYLSFRGFRLMGLFLPGCSTFSGRQLLPSLAILSSIFIQVFGLFALARVSGESYAIEQKILSRPEKVIVTDVFYVPEQMPRLFFEKKVLQVITVEDVEHLSFYLSQWGEKEFYLLLSPQFRRMNDAVLQELLSRYPLTAAPERMTGRGGFPDLYAGKCLVPPPRSLR